MRSFQKCSGMKLILLALALFVGQSLACLGGLGGSGCCSGPIGGCGAQPVCSSGGGYGYSAPIAGPPLPPPPPPQQIPYSSGGNYAQPNVPPIGQGSYAYRGKRFVFRNRK